MVQFHSSIMAFCSASEREILTEFIKVQKEVIIESLFGDIVFCWQLDYCSFCYFRFT